VLIQLAEHLAIRFALERFERGEVKSTLCANARSHESADDNLAKSWVRKKTK